MLLKNPNALKFNVSKKLSQLMRVIQLFSAQCADREFQIHYLQELYNPQIQQNLDIYRTRAAEIDSQIKSDQQALVNEIDSMYKNRYQDIKSELENYSVAASENIAQYQEKLLKDLDSIASQLKLITNGLEEKSNATETQCEEAKAKLSEEIKKLGEVQRQELLAHAKEAEKRLNQISEESEKKIKEVNEDHEKEMESVRDAFSKNADDFHDNVIKLRDLKTKVEMVKRTIESNRENVQQLIATRDAKVREGRKMVEQISNDIKDVGKSNEEKLKEFNDKMKEMGETHSIEVEKIKKEREEKQQDIKDKIDQARKSKEEEIERFRHEIDKKMEQIKTNSNSFDESLQDLINKNNSEIDTLQKKLEAASKAATLKEEQKHKEINAVKDEYERDLQKYQKEFDELVQSHQETINAALEHHIAAMKAETEKFEMELSEIQKQIDELKEKEGEQGKNQKQELQNLIEQKNQLITEHSSFLKEHLEKLENDQTNAKSLNETERQTINDESTKKKQEKQEKHEKKQIDITQKTETEYLALEKKTEGEYQSYIDKINEEYSKRDKIEALTKEYDLKIEEKMKILNSIGTEDTTNHPKFAELDKSIEELQTQKKDLDNIVSMQKASFIKENEMKIEQENQRHASEMGVENGSNDNEKMRIELMNSIEKAKKTEEEQKERSDKEAAEIKSQNEKEIDELTTQLNNAKDQSEVDQLTKNLANLKEEWEKEKETMKQTAKETISNLKMDIKRGDKEFEIDKQNVNIKKENQHNQYQMMLRNLDNDYDEIKRKHDKAVKEQRTLANNNTKQAKVNHSQRLDQMMADFEELKNQISKSNVTFHQQFGQNRNKLQSQLDEYVRENKEKLEKHRNGWLGMRDFYDEKIQVLMKDLEGVIKKYENMPPRPQEASQIETLQMQIKTITMQLQNALKELKESRTMLKKQEEEYNKRFGKGPKVGVFTVSSSAPASRAAIKHK